MAAKRAEQFSRQPRAACARRRASFLVSWRRRFRVRRAIVQQNLRSNSKVSKAQLLALLDEMTTEATRTFASLEAARLSQPSTEPAYYSTIFEDLFGIAIHLATHTGQIVYITKMLKEGAIDELWTKTHRGARSLENLRSRK